jgi:hypothetical protein
MSEKKIPQGYLATDEPDLFFEDNTVGRLKKEVWDSSDAEIDAILADYGVPSPVEWGKPGSYIQTTTRWQVEENPAPSYTAPTSPALPTPCMSARFWKECAVILPKEAHPAIWHCLL